MRRSALPAALLAGVLLLTACGQDSGDGGRPVPVGGDSGTTTAGTPATATSKPNPESSRPATPEPTTRPKAQVIVKAGNFASNPAVKGLVNSYPLYFQALVSKDDTVLK
ncbi:hypothetical protein E1218_13580, partial [Kribbella turkmenica]